MSNFSALDIKRVEETLSPSTCYTPQKNQTSFELFLRGSEHRGKLTEHLIADWISHELGVNAKVTAGKKKGTGKGQAPHDVEYSIADVRYKRGYKKIRLECKSALADKCNWQKQGNCTYKYNAVKPNNFDYIFFFEVNPDRGLVVKWTTRKQVMSFVSERGLSRNDSGYSINIRSLEHTRRIKLYNLEDFPHES
mgnify:CR=1 FL=1